MVILKHPRIKNGKKGKMGEDEKKKKKKKTFNSKPSTP